MDMKNEGRGFIHTKDGKNTSIEDIAAKMLLNHGDQKGHLAYINARAGRDKLVNDICKNIDDINEIIEKNCDTIIQVAMLDACINLLDNIKKLNVVSFHIGFLTDSALDDTTGINADTNKE